MPRRDGFTKYEEKDKRTRPTKREKIRRRRRANSPKRTQSGGWQKSRREKLKQTRKRLNARADLEALQIQEEGR